MKGPAHGLALGSALVLWALPNGAGAASQLFKCIEGGRTVYQQQACPVSAQAETAASGPRAAARPDATSAPAAASAAHKLMPVSRPATSVPATPR